MTKNYDKIQVFFSLAATTMETDHFLHTTLFGSKSIGVALNLFLIRTLLWRHHWCAKIVNSGNQDVEAQLPHRHSRHSKGHTRIHHSALDSNWQMNLH